MQLGMMRVEGPEQTKQFAQLAAVRDACYHKEETRDPSRVDCRATFVGKLILKSRLEVPVQALTNMSHDREAEVRAAGGPPSLTQTAWTDARQQLEVEKAVPWASARAKRERIAEGCACSESLLFYFLSKALDEKLEGGRA